jgi:acetyltransferase-like isoleucine patch superfamily enzyme
MLRKLYRNTKNFLHYGFNQSIKIGTNVATHASFLEGKNKLCENTVFVNSYLGLGSYIGANCNFNAVHIGRYCSIGSNIKVITANHPTKAFVSMHPAFFSLSKQAGFTYVSEQKFEEQKFLDKNKGISVQIGNDVWIGEDVMILGGIKIGDGALIGARSLVIKDVAPFSKVGGEPAKEIGKRFSNEEIKFLMELRWWDKDEEWLRQHIYLFENITLLIESEKNRNRQ